MRLCDDLKVSCHAVICLPVPAGVILPRPADTASTGEAAEAALINGGGGDESPSGQAPMYAPVPAGPFPWDSEVEERFARFVAVRISVRHSPGFGVQTGTLSNQRIDVLSADRLLHTDGILTGLQPKHPWATILSW